MIARSGRTQMPSAIAHERKSGRDEEKLALLDCQWLLQELDRMWFHDNALGFQVGDWIRSLHRSCWRWDRSSSSRAALELEPRSKSWSSQHAAAATAAMDSSSQIVEMEVVSRSLLDTGRVFSTGDIPRPRLEKLDREDDQCSDSSSAISAERVPDGGGTSSVCEEEQLTPLKLEAISSALILGDLEPPTQEPEASASSSSVVVPTTQPRRRKRPRSQQQRRKTIRSLSELEFDELRGLRDLGFKPSKEDLTPRRVVSLATSRRPPSSKKGSGASGDQSGGRVAERIYPSHAWSIRRPDSPLLNLRMPDLNRQGVEDMKAHLKFWARTVASTVRQEC